MAGSEQALTDLHRASAAEIDLQSELAHRRKLEGKLAFVEGLNRLLVDSSDDCILLAGPDGRLLSLNPRGRQLLELDEMCSWLDREWWTLFPELDHPAWEEFCRGGGAITSEASSKTLKGSPRWWRLTLTPIFDAHRCLDRVLIVARDLTRHTLIEKALRESERAFRKLFEANPIGIVLADLDYRILNVNDAICGMLGYSQRELTGRDVRGLRAGPADAETEDFDRLARGELRVLQREVPMKSKSGERVWGFASTSLLRDSENKPSAFFQMIENITVRKGSEEQVLAYQQQLQSLASELALSEERERRRIATNLHDRIGQSLAFAKLKLGTIGQQTNSQAVAELRELIEQTIADTRSLTFELSPPVLYELGLVAAVEWLARKIQQEHGIPTRFQDDGQPKPVDENFRIVLFQAVRELLVNVVKHARASHAQVLMRRDADALRIIIEDDGVGFAGWREGAKSEPSRTFGLFNVRERVEYLGGKVKIWSEPRRGTRVTLIAPIKVEANETGADPDDS